MGGGGGEQSKQGCNVRKKTQEILQETGHFSKHREFSKTHALKCAQVLNSMFLKINEIVPFASNFIL